MLDVSVTFGFLYKLVPRFVRERMAGDRSENGWIHHPHKKLAWKTQSLDTEQESAIPALNEVQPELPTPSRNRFPPHELEIIVHRAASHVSSLDILISLRQITAQYLQVGMSHQLLKGKYIHAIAEHDQSKRTPKIMGSWNVL